MLQRGQVRWELTTVHKIYQCKARWRSQQVPFPFLSFPFVLLPPFLPPSLSPSLPPFLHQTNIYWVHLYVPDTVLGVGIQYPTTATVIASWHMHNAWEEPDRWLIINGAGCAQWKCRASWECITRKLTLSGGSRKASLRSDVYTRPEEYIKGRAVMKAEGRVPSLQESPETREKPELGRDGQLFTAQMSFT